MKLLLTGKIGIGKSTILNKAINKYNIKYGIFTKKSDKYLYAYLLNSNKKYIIGEKTLLGMSINYAGFELITYELKKITFPDFFVVDEIGFLEEKYVPYLNELERIIEESRNFIGIIRLFFHERYYFLKDLPIIEITEENRGNIEL
ncbi:hypothetical protein X275_08095 [Marinitoga sp. 1197]|uniref:nucleoside-triphosphatase n=1 Tax=Marinitoga sp. 1197 TaxID=1428449 RepID=UPI0006414A8E|nr:nucleoside-triphosphatase [Marinitoga sp. 1197]KLO21851.1 hypothetical protein X275_08095 [Marinitoga sp. 1197]